MFQEMILNDIAFDKYMRMSIRWLWDRAKVLQQSLIQLDIRKSHHHMISKIDGNVHGTIEDEWVMQC